MAGLDNDAIFVLFVFYYLCLESLVILHIRSCGNNSVSGRYVVLVGLHFNTSKSQSIWWCRFRHKEILSKGCPCRSL